MAAANNATAVQGTGLSNGTAIPLVGLGFFDSATGGNQNSTALNSVNLGSDPGCTTVNPTKF